MENINSRIVNASRNEGVDFVRYLDISQLANIQNRGFTTAVLIGIPINPKFIKQVSDDPDYIHTLEDEYAQTENRAGEVADKIAKIIIEMGYKAISQSDAALLAEGAFNFDEKQSLLPHKTVATLSGLGWIGKNNLFITPEFGAAQCLGTILTDAPLNAASHEPLLPKCGNCGICGDICEKQVLKGKVWSRAVSRDEIVDVHGCSACLKCLVHCPRTQAYAKRTFQAWL